MWIARNTLDMVVARVKDVPQGVGVSYVLGRGEVETLVVEIDVSNGVLVLAPRAGKASLAERAQWVAVSDAKNLGRTSSFL